MIHRQTHPRVLKVLLSQQPELATRTFGEWRMTLLHIVSFDVTDCFVNVVHLCRCLVRYGADTRAENTEGETPLHQFRQIERLTADVLLRRKH